MGRKKCKDSAKKNAAALKDEHFYECRKCGMGAKKEEQLCKPKKRNK